MLLLALAFGVIEEGIVDETLFNPIFFGEHLLRFGFIPALGIAGPWTVFVLTLHVIWSIGAPIAIAEGLFPRPLPRRVAIVLAVAVVLVVVLAVRRRRALAAPGD